MGNSRAFVARSVSSAAARATSGRSRPSTIVMNGPLRFGAGQRAIVKAATACSSGPTSRCRTPTIVCGSPSKRIGRPRTDGSPPNRRNQ